MHSMLTEGEIASRLDFACEIAAEAGRRLLALRSAGRWSDETVLGDVADHMADAFLQGCLRGRHPGDGVLSEETADSGERRGKRFVWIVDPLDGTKEYRSGRQDWAVHVGLAVDGVPLLGAVAQPSLLRTLGGSCGPGQNRFVVQGETGTHRCDVSALDADATPLRLATSRSHTPPWIERFAEDLGRHRGGVRLVPSGSVGFKVGLLLSGEADLYVHDKGLKEWDTCAPEAVARAAGWSVCRLDGATQRYNEPDPRNDELVVCRRGLLPDALAALRRHAPRFQTG